MIEIGTGGGSIAEINERRLISVGPRSAGADPGPACYTRGGTEATLTDPDAIRTRLAQIRATGMAEVVGGLESDVHSLAVPLFDATGGCIGALAVATPTARMTPALRATIAGALFCNARRLVAGWGGLLPDRMQDMWSDAV